MSFSATARWRVLGPGDEVDLSIEITHGGLEHIDPILELTESAIAVEAQQPANLARCVVVVDLSCCSGATNGAQAALRSHHCVRIGSRDSVPSLEVIRARTTDFDLAQSASCVMARLAVGSTPGFRVLVSRELANVFDGLTIWAPLHSLHEHLGTLSARGDPASLPAALAACRGAGLAVERQTIRPPYIRVVLRRWLDVPAVRASFHP